MSFASVPSRWFVAWATVALVVAFLPLALAQCCAPAGHTGFGTVWFVNDFAQYEGAVRQGAERADWLIVNQFTPEPHAPAFMFPLYVGIGKLAALLDVSAMALERGVEVVARLLLLVALWRFAQTFAHGRAGARAAFLLAVFGGGLGFLVAPLSALFGITQPYVGNWSYETTGFGLLFAAPHVPLGMAVTLELARYLAPSRPRVTRWALAYVVLLAASASLLHPFHMPALLVALGICGLVWWRAGMGAGTLVVAIVAALAALPPLVPTVLTFTFDRFWGTTYTSQNLLPSPLPHELWVDLGVTALLAIGAVRVLGRRAAPFGLLLWLMIGLTLMYAPVPYQRRLSFGIQPALAVLAANGLVALCASLSARRAAWTRLGAVALAAGGTMLLYVAIVVSVLLPAGPLPIYRSTPDLDRAAQWLAGRVQPHEVILADWDTSNYLAPRTPGRVFGGHPVATLRPDEKRFLLATYFAHDGNLALARQLGARWVVYGPRQAAQPGPVTPPVFEAGDVRVYRVAS